VAVTSSAVLFPVSSGDPCNHADPGPGCCLIRQLRLTRMDDYRFMGGLRGGRTERRRAFGGGLIAQALLAAGATVPAGQAPGSLHASFVSPGDTGQPMGYTVTELGAGRSSSLRQVTADQDGVTRLVVLASFRTFADTGASHQRTPPVTGAPPGPDAGAGCWCDTGDLTCGLAHHPAPPGAEPGAAPGAHRASWVRLRHGLGARPLWHAAVLGYMSDIATIRTVDQPHRGEPGRRLAASADHALWFHRPFRADEWLWYGQRSPVYASGRGICQGEFYDTAGRLVASCAQEVSLRRVPSEPGPGAGPGR
jgi:acyl-CoA thioesterase II